MIPLSLNIETDITDDEPFVLKVQRQQDGQVPVPVEQSATIIADLGSAVLLECHRGQIYVFGIMGEEIVGDVVLVYPKSKNLQRLIRGNSRDNTLLITERCDQLCIMCSQPPMPHHDDRFSYFRDAILLSEPNKQIGLSGGEPTLYLEELLSLLDLGLSQRPDLTFHVLTNGQHFRQADAASRRIIGSRAVLWGVPMYAPEAALHDEIVGLTGAFDELCDGLAILLNAGASVELRTVVMQQNKEALPHLARFLRAHLSWIRTWAIMQVERMGYGRKNWNSIFFDSSVEFSFIQSALAIAVAHGIKGSLYNFPRCTVPSEWRHSAGPTISDWKRRYLSVCNECDESDLCTGVFEWYREETGFRNMGAL